jgi:hypothetical protein
MVAISDDTFSAICEDLAERGMSLRKSCEAHGLKVNHFLYWVEADKARGAQYARARDRQADHFGERVSEIADGVLSGEYDYNAARVAVDALKWSAGKMKPKRWGDRVEHEHTGEIHIKRVVLNDEDEGPKSLPGIVDVEAKQIEE